MSLGFHRQPDPQLTLCKVQRGGYSSSEIPMTLRTERDVQDYEREQALELRIPSNVYGLFSSSAFRYGDRPALSMVMSGADDEEIVPVSYGELHRNITRAANLFASVGGSGVGVAYILPTLLETHYTLWGAEAVGYAVPLNPLLQVDHLAALLSASEARILVTCGPTISPDIWAKAEALRKQLPGLLVVCIQAPESSDSCIDFHTAMQAHSASSLLVVDDPHRVVAYFHTGGTTGTPKLVGHTHRNQLAAALGAAKLLDLQEGDVITNGMPLFHVGGAIASSLAFFMTGGHVVTLSPLGLRNPAMVKNFWRIAERQRVTVLGAVPTALSAILGVPLNADLRHVRFGITGSAPTPRKVADMFKQVTGRELYEILGMTETGGVTAIDPAGGPSTPGSVGLRVPYTGLSIRRRNADGTLGDECAPGEVGVLVVTGPTVSPGYKSATAAASAFADNQLDAGDLAFKNEEGKLFIAGRTKDLIIRGGHNIDPAMIEDAFLAHPAVAAAAAVGELDAYAGELPVCYVVLNQGASLACDELLDFARERIAERPAWPKQVYVLPTLPLTAVGKIYKPALRADAAQRVLAHALRTIAGDAVASVTASEGGPRGLRVEVHLTSASADVAARVQAALAAYVVEANVVVS